MTPDNDDVVSNEGAPAAQQPVVQPVQQTPVQAQSPQTVVQPQQAQPSADVVSNTPVDPHANHPAIKQASVLHSLFSTLAGGDRTETTVDPTTGQVTRKPVPLTTKEIGMGLAASVLMGAFSGLSQTGPGATGRAAASGFQTVAQQRMQADQEQEKQAQADAHSKSVQYAQTAAIADVNARTLLNTAEAESRGADTLAKIAAANKPLIDSYEDNGNLIDRNIDQQQLIAGMQTGTYDSTAQLGPIDGYRLLGNGRVEATHSVIHDPTAKVPVSQEQWNSYADAHVPGFHRAHLIGDGTLVSGTILARANEQKHSVDLAAQRHDEVTDALRKSDDPKVKALADTVPSLASVLNDPKTSAGVFNALGRFQAYESHADISHGGRDIYQSLQTMAQPSKVDPNNPKSFIPNRDAPFANTVAGAFAPDGNPQTGWAILKSYHDQVAPLPEIKTEGEAAQIVATSDPGSRLAKYASRWIASNTAQKTAIASGEAKAKEAAKPSVSADSLSLTQPDVFGNVPTITDPKEASKRFGSFKKNLDSLSQTNQTYDQFQSIANDVKAGRLTGAESVVALLAAVGISAAPMKGNGFRISKDILSEHKNARGWEQSLQQKFLGAKDGDLITPKQILDYSNIAANARTSQYVNLANQMRAAGLSIDPALPSGNGRQLDANTAQIFKTLAGGDMQKAMAAAASKGWR